MSHYGYFDCEENYSDVDTTPTKAVCPHCGRHVICDREQADWNKDKQRWEHDDLCSELEDTSIAQNRMLRPHEW